MALFSFSDLSQSDFAVAREPLFGSGAEPGSLAEYLSARRESLLEQTLATQQAARVAPLSISYADPPDPNAVPFDGMAGDWYTLDPDFDGSRTVAYGERAGLPLTSNDIVSLNVFGRAVSRDKLMRSEDGRRLLEIAGKTRDGVKRGFLTALSEVSVSDLPFVGMIASVRNSFRDAQMVSDTFRKLRNKEDVSDEELIRARLYMAEQDYRSNNTTLMGTVGDIARHAPGFMAEFAATSFIGGAVRGAASRALPESTALAMNRATKILAREFTEKAAGEALAKAGARTLANLSDDAAKAAIESGVADDIANFMLKAQMEKTAYKGLSSEAIRELAKKRAGIELARYASRTSGGAVARGLKSFGQWATHNLSRGLLDFGTYGTEESTILYTSRDSIGKSLADAAGAWFVEAPVRGAMMWAPNQFVARPAVGALWGADGRVVTENRLSFEAAALRTGNWGLMDCAESMSMGLGLMEYISENTGRGLNSVFHAAGLGLERAGVKGLVTPSRLVDVAAGLADDGKGYAIGARLREMILSSGGTRQEFMRAAAGRQAEAVAAKLGVTDVAGKALIRNAVESGSAASLPDAMKAAIGNDFRKFAAKALDEMYDRQFQGKLNRAYMRYVLGDFMARHNLGAESVLNLWRTGGYDGVLGEMFEERYADVVNGLLGLDANPDGPKWRSEPEKFWRNLKAGLASAKAGALPGWDQLVAEAVGFAIPGVTRTLALRAQSAIGGEGKLTKMRARLDAIAEVNRVTNPAQMTWSDYVGVHEMLQEKDRAEIERLGTLRDAARAAGDESKAKDLEEQIAETTKVVERREARHNSFSATVDEVAKANGELLAVPLIPSRFLADDLMNKLTPTYSARDAEAGLSARDNLADYAPELARDLYTSEMHLEGEEPAWYRRAAHKIVGFAAALATGDFGMAAVNPSQWTARDMGLEENTVKALKSGFREEYLRTRREMAVKAEGGKPTQAQVLDEAQRRFAQRARDIMRADTTVSQLRSFSQGLFRSQALEYAAAHHEDPADPRPYLSAIRDGKPVLYRLTEDKTAVDETSVIPAEEFAEAHRDEVEAAYRDILRATTDLVVRGLSYSANVDGKVVQAVDNAVNSRSDLAAIAVYDAAARIVGEDGLLHRIRTDEGDVPLAEILRGGAVSTATADAIEYIGGKANVSDVDGIVFESVAQSMRRGFDGTEKGLAARNDEIFRMAKLLTADRDRGTEYYSKPVEDLRGMAARLSPNGTERARLRETGGKWVVGIDGQASETFGTRDEAVASLVEHGWARERGRYVITQAKVIEFGDMFHALRELGYSGEYYRALGGVSAQNDSLHPMLRQKESGELLEEDAARDVLARELAAAARGETADAGTDERKAWERVWGETGYMTVGERILTRHGVEKDGSSAVTGEAAAYTHPRYTFKMSAGRVANVSSDVFIQVDPTVNADMMDAVLNGVMLRAFLNRGHLLSTGATGENTADYIRQLSAVADQAIEDAYKAKDVPLAEQIRNFRDSYLRGSDVVVETEDGRYEARHTAGLTGEGFARIVSAFVLNRAEKYKENPFLRAAAVLAERARRLPSYAFFMNTADLVLGGDGFLSEAVRAANRDKSAPAEPRGVAALMAWADGDAEAMRKSLEASLPAGMTYSQFLDRMLQGMTSMLKSEGASREAASPKETEELKEAAKEAETPKATAAEAAEAHLNFMSRLVGVLKRTAEMTREGSVPRAFTKVMAKLMEDAVTDPTVTEAQKTAARGMLGEIKRALYNVDQTPAERVAEAANAKVDAEERRNEARRNVIDAMAKLDAAAARVEGTEAVAEAAAESGASVEDLNAEVNRARAEYQAADDAAKDAATNLDKVQAETGARVVRASDLGGRAGATWSPRSVTAIDSNDDTTNDDIVLEDDPTVVFGGTRELPAMAPDAANLDGFTVMHGLEVGPAGRHLEPREADTAAAVAVRALLASGEPVNRAGVAGVLRKMFPGMDAADRAEVLAAYTRMDDDRVRNRGDWSDAASSGVWFFAEDVKDDESLSSDDYNRVAVDEYTSDAMRTFLALAAKASPETGANLQGFVRLARGSVRADAAPSDAGKFLYRILNPRANREGASLPQHDALLREDLLKLGGEEANGYIRSLLGNGTDGRPVSRKGAFLLSYLTSMRPNGRFRLARLMAYSVAATPIALKENEGGGMVIREAQSRGGGRIAESLVADSFAELDGRPAAKARELKDQLLKAADDAAGWAPKQPANATRAQLIAAVKQNMRVLSGIIGQAFGRESPLCTALSSDMAFAQLARVRTEVLQNLALTLRPHGYSNGVTALRIRDGMPVPAEIERPDKTKYQPKAQTVEFIDTIAYALDSLSRMSGNLSRSDISAVMTAAIATGNPQAAGVAGASSSVAMESPVFSVLDIFQNSLPTTIMAAEIDQRRGTKASSIAVAPRDLVPLVSRWLYADESTALKLADGTTLPTFAETCRRFFPGVTDEVIAECRQDATWPDAARTPICAKCLSASFSPNEVYEACRRSYEAMAGDQKRTTYYVPLFSGDHSSNTLLQIPREVDLTVEALQQVAQQPTQTVSQPKGPINVWHGTGENAEFSNLASRPFSFQGHDYVSVEHAYQTLKSGSFDETTYRQRWAAGKKIRSFRQADTRTNVQLMRDLVFESFRQNPEAKRALLDTGSATFTHTQDRGIWATEFPKALSEARQRLRQETPAATQPSDKKHVPSYEEASKAVYRAIGMALMGVDAKRSAISSLEATGVGMVGTRVGQDGNRTWGENRIHVGENFRFYDGDFSFGGENGYAKKPNEALLGSTFMRGYAARALKETAQDPSSSLLKVHLISTQGRDLFFGKSLSVATSSGSGEFAPGSADRAIDDYLAKYRGADDLSTDVFTDRDSYKIGPLSSKSITVTVKAIVGGQERKYGGTLMKVIYDLAFDKAVDGKFSKGDLKDGERKQVLFDELDKALRTAFGGGVSGDQLDAMFGDIAVKDDVRGESTMKLSELLPGAELRYLPGLSGPALDFSYREDGAMAYPVANVSHNSRLPNVPGRSPRNYEVDMATMATALARFGALDNAPGLAQKALGLIADWGVFANAVYSNPEYVRSVTRRARHFNELREAGESAGGQFAREELARQVWAEIRQASNLPLGGVDMALVSSGAALDDNGKLFTMSASQMQRDVMRGSCLYSKSERGFYGADRNFALCNVNYSQRNFRYAWFLDEGKFRTAFDSEISGALLDYTKDHEGVLTSGQLVALGIARVFENLRGTKDRGERSALRRRIAECFKDHHGRYISDIPGAADNFGFDDLFRDDPKGTGAQVFDLTAVMCESRDQIFNDATGQKHIVLGGTMFGLPRTPSYNGSMWLQVVRAGLPATEIEEKDTKGKTLGWRVGADAMVQPDPFTNQLLGCDHDGDKTKAYLLYQSWTGQLPEAEIPQYQGDPDKIENNPDGVRALLTEAATFRADKKTRKFLEAWRYDPESDTEKPVDEATEAGEDVYYKISEDARRRVSNTFVKALFEMARHMPVHAAVDQEGNKLQLVDRFSSENSGVPRETFLAPDGLVSAPTKAFPVSGAAAEELRHDMLPPTLSNEDKRDLGDPKVAAEVSTSAKDAGDARGIAVALARNLHLAWLASDAFPRMFRNNAGLSENWWKFAYHLDGISNATFDDVKEQLCGRLGWTREMLESVYANLLNYVAAGDSGLPVTDQAFADVLGAYIKDIKNGGRFLWALAATRRGAANGPKFADMAKAVAGDSADPNNITKAWLEKALDLTWESGSLQLGSATPAWFRTVMNSGLKRAERRKLITELAKDGGHNPVFGYVAWLASGHESSAPAFARWFGMKCELDDARSFGQAINYLTADPGSPNATALGDSVREAFTSEDGKATFDVAKAVEIPGLGPLAGTLSRMHAATRMAYSLGEGLQTVMAGAMTAYRDGTDPKEPLVSESDRLKSWDAMHIESNAEQLPYVHGLLSSLAAFPVAGSVFKDGRQMYAAMREMAGEVSRRAVAADEAAKLRRAAVNKRVSAESAQGEEKQAYLQSAAIYEKRADKISTKDVAPAPTVLAFRRGVEAMFGMMYRSIVTSEEFNSAAGNKAFAYISARRDTGYGEQTYYIFGEDSDGKPHKYFPYGRMGDGLLRIGPTYRENDTAANERVRAMFDDVIAGRAYAGERRVSVGFEGDGMEAANATTKSYARAKGYTLTADNVDALVKEAGNASAELKAMAEDAKAALGALKENYGIDAVTPAMLVGQILPFYSLVTSRVTGTPSGASPSLFGILPDRYYRMLSASEAALGPESRAILVANDMAPEARTPAGKPRGRVQAPFRHSLELFSGDRFERMVNAVDAYNVGHVPNAAPEPPARPTLLSKGAYDERAANAARAMGRLLSSWANVEYLGGTAFTIRGKLRGNAGLGRRVSIVVETAGKGLRAETEEDVERLANSRAFAASYCAAVNLGTKERPFTADDFARLPLEIRKELARKATIGGVTSHKVEWSFSGKGAQTLVGAIQLPAGAKGTELYHEYFHSMMRMFEAIGLFGEADYEALRKQFGTDPSRAHGFNEEAAAEAFRKWVEGDAGVAGAETRGVFQRILDFLKGFWDSLKNGFNYGDEGFATDNTVFNMVVHGIAETSRARNEEAIASAVAAGTEAAEAAAARARENPDDEAAIAEAAGMYDSVARLEEGDETAIASVLSNAFAPAVSETVRTPEELEAAAAANVEAPVLGNTIADFGRSKRWHKFALANPEAAEKVRAADLRVMRRLTGEERVPDAEFRRLLAESAETRRSVADDRNAAPVSDTEDFFEATPADPAGTPSANASAAAGNVRRGTLPLSVSNDFYATARWIRESMEHGLKTDGSWSRGLEYVTRKYALPDPREVARDRVIVMNGLRRALATVNPEALGKLNDKDIRDSIAFQAALRMYHSLEASFITRTNVDAATGEAKPANSRHDKITGDFRRDPKARHASMYQVSAWVTSSDPVAPSKVAARAAASAGTRLKRAMENGAGGELAAELLFQKQQMDALAAMVKDPGSLARYVETDGAETIDRVMHALWTGVRAGKPDARGRMPDFVPVNEVDERGDVSTARLLDDDDAPVIARRRALVSDPEFQRGLKACVSAAYQVAAMAKFYRETGTEPATPEDLEFQKAARERHGVPAGLTAAEWLAAQAAGDSNLAGDAGLVDYSDQSSFIAENVSAWSRSLIRKSFGAKGNIGEMLSAEMHEYDAIKGEIARLENFHAFLFGDNVEAGGRILKLLEHDATHALEDGQVVWAAGGKYLKFDNYRRQLADIVLTESDLRIIDIFKKMCAARASRQDRVVTGVADIRFHGGMNRDPAFYSREAIARRLANSEQLDALSFALRRMDDQIPPEILEPYRRRFVASAIAAMAEADGDKLVRASGPTSARYNALVISALRERGLVEGMCRDNYRYDVDGLPRFTSAAATIPCDEINDAFLGSEAYRKLTSDKGGRKPEMLDRDAIIKDMMAVYSKAVRFAKAHPWLTHGDGAYFSNFGTALPFWRGSGVFMYNAQRALRDRAADRQGAASRDYERMKAVVDSEFADVPVRDLQADKVINGLDMLSNLYGIGVSGQPLIDLIAAGGFEPGSARSRRTGLELPADATYAGLAEAIYSKSLQNAWAAKFGTKEEAGIDYRAAMDVVDAYRDAALTRGELFGGAVGLNDLDMFRRTGTLPANYQIGHKVHVAIDGLANAMMSRATLANMLMTPAYDGAPVYYADPSDIAADVSGLPDAFWQNVARWWCEYNGDAYDEKLSGVQNAKREFAALRAKMTANKGVLGTNPETACRYREHKDANASIASVERWLVREAEEAAPHGRIADFAIDKLGLGEALGYLQQFLGASRAMGTGGPAARSLLHRALGWSKAMSVSFSFFFPLATRFESPTAAVGALATLGGNYKPIADYMREHPKAFDFLRKLPGGPAWITKNFLGFSDIVDMMDSNDPFLAELYAWANALGVRTSTSLVSPLEDAQAMTQGDLDHLKRIIRDTYGAEIAAKFGRMARDVALRQSDKAFNYALNATKLAVTAQLATKLRYLAERQGKAFDPIRDLKKYADYINAEVGGLDPLKYSWAHPANRRLLNVLMFSWQWTRGAWEAGGGKVLEDLAFGTNTASRQERAHYIGRWARMLGLVMLGFPQVLQILSTALAKVLDAAAGGMDGDDDDRLSDEEFYAAFHRERTAAEKVRFARATAGMGGPEFLAKYGRGRDRFEMAAYADRHSWHNRDVWFTWQNEDRARWKSADITPLLRAIARFDDTRLGGALRSFKRGGRFGAGVAGAAAGAVAGYAGGGNWLTGLVGAGLGATAGRVSPDFIPLYMGDDPANGSYNRRVYVHAGKQGWEEVRWFEDPIGQFLSKLSMPAQRVTEGILGFNPGYMAQALPWSEMGWAERWLSPTVDGATWNLMQAWMPFSFSGMTRNRDAGFVSMALPVQRGASKTALGKELTKQLDLWARNDRRGYATGDGRGRYAKVNDVLLEARRNGYDPAALMKSTSQELLAKYYGELFRALMKYDPSAPFDSASLNRPARAALRLGGAFDRAVASMRSRVKSSGARVGDAEGRAMYLMLGQAYANPNMAIEYGPEVREAANGGAALGNFLATDKIPDTIFGIKVVQTPEEYTEADLEFFREHPRAAGFYELEGEGR